MRKELSIESLAHLFCIPLGNIDKLIRRFRIETVVDEFGGFEGRMVPLSELDRVLEQMRASALLLSAQETVPLQCCWEGFDLDELNGALKRMGLGE